MAISRFVILGVGFVAALSAAYVAVNMSSEGSNALVEQNSDPDKKVEVINKIEVLALTRNVTLGETLKDSLEWKPWLENQIGEGFILRDQMPDALEKFEQSLASSNLYIGEALQKNRLVESGNSLLASLLPKGKRAISIRIAVESAAGGFILPNDKVDILITRRVTGRADSSENVSSETLLENIKVLAIDQSLKQEGDDAKSKIGETATLEVDPNQAEILIAAQQVSEKLVLVLRSSADSKEEENNTSSNSQEKSIKLIKAGEFFRVGIN